MIDLIRDLLSAIGIDPTSQPYFAIGALVIIGVVYLRISIGGTLQKVRDNLLVIITHLATSRTAKLDTNLIKQMSPLFIQPEGQKILEESGLKKIMEDSSCKRQILKHIEDMNPSTKLDVEQKSIILFETIMQNDFMNPIKAYLYEHPSLRETYPTLAGVYIRDQYLAEHLEIVQ